jgi:hypothetical protein
VEAAEVYEIQMTAAPPDIRAAAASCRHTRVFIELFAAMRLIKPNEEEERT